MKKNKTLIWVLVIVLLVAAAAIIWKVTQKNNPEPVTPPTEDVTPADPTDTTDPTDPTDPVEPADPTDPDADEPGSEDEGAGLIEDGGDIVIVIPDDQGSGGL